MQLIELRQRLADNFGDPINHVLQLMNTLSQANKAEKIVLDYKDAKFTSPFYLLAIPLIVKQYINNGYDISISTDFRHNSIKDYMNYIHFPNGVYPGNMAPNFEAFVSKYEGKSYIPIICFPTGDSIEVSSIRDTFLSGVNRLLVRICGISANMTTALMYLIDEAVNNVLHHSQAQNGYLFAQYYKSKGYIDLVVADVGRTFLDTYANFDKFKDGITDHKLAMTAALSGKSTKSENVDRGFGISTSKDLLTKGLNGKYFIYSGNVFNIHTSEINDIIELPKTIHWQGMYLCLRIPVVPQPGFNPANYYE